MKKSTVYDDNIKIITKLKNCNNNFARINIFAFFILYIYFFLKIFARNKLQQKERFANKTL